MLSEEQRAEVIYFQRTMEEIINFIKWMIIGTAAAAWGYFATKFRNDGKKKRYSVMMLPLFAVIAMELMISFTANMMYCIQEYKIAHGTLLPEERSQASDWSTLAVTLFILGLCVYQLYQRCKKLRSTFRTEVDLKFWVRKHDHHEEKSKKVYN